jgi:coenzyme F420-dependent glucose-6-phosphate dehydrogenase
LGSPGRIVALGRRTSTRPPPPHRSTPCPYRQLLKNFENAAREAGKDPAQMPKLIELNVEYTNDPESAIEVHRKYWAGTYIPALFDQKIYTPKMSQENGEAVGPDTIKKSGCVSANPDDHVKFAQKYIELGFTHLIFHSAAQDQRGFLESFGRDVLPRLR